MNCESGPTRNIGCLRHAGLIRLLASNARRLRYVTHCAPGSRQTVTVQKPEEDFSSPREECGVFGVWAPGEDVAKLAYYGLYSLQHRGQEAAGIAVSDGSRIVEDKDMGLVAQVFNESVLNTLRGHVAVGHCRYSTSGSSVWENAQPTFRATPSASLALGHNGNLINTLELATRLAQQGGG